MKKSIKHFEDKKIKNTKAVKGGNNGEETKQVKFRRVTFKLL